MDSCMLVRLINLGPSPALESKCIIMEKLKNTRIQLHARLSMLSAESRAAQPASKLWRQRPEGAAAQASSNGARGKLVLALSSLPHLDFTEGEQICAWGNTDVQICACRAHTSSWPSRPAREWPPVAPAEVRPLCPSP